MKTEENESAGIFYYLDEEMNIENKENCVNKIIDKIPLIEEIGYAGYKEKEQLRQFLINSIFRKELKIGKIDVNKEECLAEINKVLRICSGIIDKNKVNIFVFPTFDSFVIQKMEGVSGFSSWKNSCLIFINPVGDWKKNLRFTVAHELAHALSDYPVKESSLGESMISEGLAEHFREAMLGGDKALWVKAISKKRAIEIFNELKSSIKNSNYDLYKEVFFGTGKYELWAGYSIGYYLVEEYFKITKKINWKKIIRIPANDILNTIKDLKISEEKELNL